VNLEETDLVLSVLLLVNENVVDGGHCWYLLVGLGWLEGGGVEWSGVKGIE
jgi:hypothetical protein